VAELNFHVDADLQMNDLEAESAKVEILSKVNAVLALIASDPTDSRLRRRRFSNGLWAVEIRSNSDELTILWDGEDLPESVTIRFIGQIRDRRAPL
jgi:hypothetical protein